MERRSDEQTSCVNEIATNAAQRRRTTASSSSDHFLPFVPYPNLGNTCFLNSSLQFFRAVWNRVGTAIPIDSPCPIFPLLLHPVSDADLASRIRQLPIWRKLVWGEQHDAHEAMHLMLETDHVMHQQCNPLTCFAHKMKEFCALSFYSNLKCTNIGCPWTKNTSPEFALDLSVAIKDSNSLPGLLKVFQKSELLTSSGSYICGQCGSVVRKEMHVKPTAKVFLAHFKRFDERNRKCGKTIKFPRELRVGNVRFAFAAMVQHVGHAKKQGHYVTYVAEDMINHDDSKVLCYDDSHVFETTWSHIASREAYMLAYVRKA